MNDRYLYRAKRKKDEKWTIWNAVTGIHGIERIEDDTICQCTGLKDKNGNLIWENDIVRDKRMKYLVIVDEEEGSLMLKSTYGAMYGIGGINSKKYEVIGNIFDNPELLEVGE